MVASQPQEAAAEKMRKSERSQARIFCVFGQL